MDIVFTVYRYRTDQEMTVQGEVQRKLSNLSNLHLMNQSQIRSVDMRTSYCIYCSRTTGSTLKCSVKRCSRRFHPLCGRTQKGTLIITQELLQSKTCHKVPYYCDIHVYRRFV